MRGWVGTAPANRTCDPLRKVGRRGRKSAGNVSAKRFSFGVAALHAGGSGVVTSWWTQARITDRRTHITGPTSAIAAVRALGGRAPRGAAAGEESSEALFVGLVIVSRADDVVGRVCVRSIGLLVERLLSSSDSRMPSGDSLTGVIHCPDCGGVVGATRTTDAGVPCTCFQRDRNGNGNGAEAAATSGSYGLPDPSGTHVMDSPAPREGAKLCWKCGKDLSGHRRFKDSYGYWCKDCHRADQRVRTEQEEEGKIKCASCGRAVRSDVLQAYEGDLICSRCLKERREIKQAGSKRFRAVSDKAYKQTEYTRLFILLGVVVLLGLIILLRHMGYLGGH
jgi:hypothetical protein